MFKNLHIVMKTINTYISFLLFFKKNMKNNSEQVIVCVCVCVCVCV